MTVTVPELTSLECVATLQKLGFFITTVTDQHVALTRDARVIVVPRHQILAESTLRHIAKRAGLTLEEILATARSKRPVSGEHALTVPDCARAKRARRS